MEKTAEKVMETPEAIEKEVATEEQLRKAMEDIQKRSSEALNSQLAKKAETEAQIAGKKEEVRGFFGKLKSAIGIKEASPEQKAAEKKKGDLNRIAKASMSASVTTGGTVLAGSAYEAASVSNSLGLSDETKQLAEELGKMNMEISKMDNGPKKIELIKQRNQMNQAWRAKADAEVNGR